MQGRERTSQKIVRFLMTGVILLIFILLAIQLGYFLKKVYCDLFCEVDVCAQVTEVCEGIALVQEGDECLDGEAQRKSLESDGERRTMKWHAEERLGEGGDSGEGKITEEGRSSDLDLSVGKDYTPILYKKRDALARRISKLDLNSADSVALLKLYGIGPYFAGKIIQYRDRLGGSYASVYQLCEIWGMDSVRFAGVFPKVCVDTLSIKYLDFYTLSKDSLARHPYVGSYAASGIIRYRSTVSREEFTLDNLVSNGIVSQEKARGMRLYFKCKDKKLM